MIRDKWIVGVRNTLSSLAMECDSVAAIECSRLTSSERNELQKKLREVRDMIDKKLGI